MKKIALFTIAAGITLGIAACTGENKQNGSDTLLTDTAHLDTAMHMDGDTTQYEQAHANINGTKSDTTVSGTAHFMRQNGAVSLTLSLNVPSKANSSVAVHFHEHGDCGNNGEGAHGHWNPTGENHGEWNKDQFHSGDIGNIKLDKDGKATVNLESNRWTIGGPVNSNILNKAIIVHSGVDDYKTQPTGNSGGRIGCGVVNRM